MLQTYLNTLIQTCACLKPCPLAKSLSKTSLIEFSSFFEDDIKDNQVKDSIPNSPRSDNSEQCKVTEVYFPNVSKHYHTVIFTCFLRKKHGLFYFTMKSHPKNRSRYRRLHTITYRYISKLKSNQSLHDAKESDKFCHKNVRHLI